MGLFSIFCLIQLKLDFLLYQKSTWLLQFIPAQLKQGVYSRMYKAYLRTVQIANSTELWIWSFHCVLESKFVKYRLLQH